jgi:hypothetical protein
MLNLTIKDNGVKRLLESVPKTAHRAAEIALDKVAKEIKEREVEEMKDVFDKPVPYTLNSLKVTPTRNHQLKATVWFKEPDRMGQHYLVPQVEGGKRKLKGFERALGNDEYVPGKGAKVNQYGNVSPGQLRQILSVLGKAERYAGYSANITERSKKRNRRTRDYVVLPKGSGKLPPGIYQRVATGKGFGHKTKRTLPFGEWQKSKKSKTIAVRARGLRPIMVKGKRDPVTPRLKFYDRAAEVFNNRFSPIFYSTFNQLLRRD